MVLVNHSKYGAVSCGTSQSTMPYFVYQYYITILIWGYIFGWVGQTQIYSPSANCQVVPLLQSFVHIGETRCAIFFD